MNKKENKLLNLERTILHSDVNNFFASVECADKEELKNKPVAVTGNPEKRNGIILAKNEIAKKQSVKTGEAIWQAKQKCPDLVCLPPHYDLYEKISLKLHELYLDYTDFVEPLGLDECWLDVTNSLNYLQKTGKEIADEIRERVKEEFNITVSVGVSFSKIFAKLGSDMKKPDATTVISKENFKQMTYNLPLNSIVGIGNRLERRFENMNVVTIGDFVNLSQDIIRPIMGKTGIELQEKLSGKLIEEVPCYFNLSPPKSIGNGTTTVIDITKRSETIKVVAFLCEKIAIRMIKRKFEARTITVTIKTTDFQKYRHSKTVMPMQSYEKIFDNAMELLDSFWNYNKKIRAIRVRVSSLTNTDTYKQLSMFEDDKIKLTESLEQIKSKYGKDKIFIASDGFSFINRKTEQEEQSHK